MQNEAVKEKLDYEYERFYMECICMSKPRIFAKSSEIEWKKKLVRFLKKQLKEGRPFPEEILALDHILDDAYRYVTDHQDEKPLEELVDDWKRSAAGGH